MWKSPPAENAWLAPAMIAIEVAPDPRELGVHGFIGDMERTPLSIITRSPRNDHQLRSRSRTCPVSTMDTHDLVPFRNECSDHAMCVINFVFRYAAEGNLG
jgi:hypothetical protein